MCADNILSSSLVRHSQCWNETLQHPGTRDIPIHTLCLQHGLAGAFLMGSDEWGCCY